MAFSQADMIRATSIGQPSAVSSISPSAAELTELGQQYVDWYTTLNGAQPTNTTNLAINRSTRKGLNKAIRHTRNAALQHSYLYGNLDELEPIIMEGVFIFTMEETSPSVNQNTVRVIEEAEEQMLDYYYSQGLIRA